MTLYIKVMPNHVYTFLSLISRDQQTQGKGTSAKSGYVWRVDLKKTECFWQGWFEGLSKSFVSVAVPKMLILAGVDRLDKELTIAQMQGTHKFNLIC